jgi:hypothetical protein
MKPRIVSIDPDHPIGSLVIEYGNDRYQQGVLDGFVAGTVFTTILVVCLKDFLKK